MEYADHVSQSIFVKCPVEGQDDTFLIIWTTTPWTLPANLAVAYNSQFTYVRAKVGTETYLLESTLLPKVAETCGWENVERSGKFPARNWANCDTCIRSSTRPAPCWPAIRLWRTAPARGLCTSRPGTDWRITARQPERPAHLFAGR